MESKISGERDMVPQRYPQFFIYNSFAFLNSGYASTNLFLCSGWHHLIDHCSFAKAVVPPTFTSPFASGANGPALRP